MEERTKRQAINDLDPRSRDLTHSSTDTFSKKIHRIDFNSSQKKTFPVEEHTHTPKLFSKRKTLKLPIHPSILHKIVQRKGKGNRNRNKTMTIKIVTDKDVFIGIGEISLHSSRSLDDEKITIASEFSFDEEYDYDDCSFSSTGYNDEGDYDANGGGGIDYSEENWDVSAYIGEDSVMLAKYRGLRRRRQNYISNSTTTEAAAAATPDSPAATEAVSAESTSKEEEEEEEDQSSTTGKDRTAASGPPAGERKVIIYNEYVVDEDDEEIHNTFDCSEEDSVKLASRRRTTTTTTTTATSSSSSLSQQQCNKRLRPRKDYSQLISELGDDVDYEDDLCFPLNDAL